MAGTFIQASQNGAFTSGSSIIQGFAKSQTSGNLNVIFAWSVNNTAITVSDSAGNPYTAVITNFAGTGLFLYVFVCAGIQGSAQNVVTANYNPSASFPRLLIGEWSGVSLGAVDITGIATAASAAPSVSATTTNAADLLVAACLATGAFITAPGAGYINRFLDSGFTMLEDQNVAASGAQTATVTVSTSTNWTMALIAFKQAPSGSSTGVGETVISTAFGVGRVGAA